MRFSVIHQDSYSRGELLLRTIFGAFYIAIPHGFLLFFAAIWSGILGFIAWWVVLFTGRYPQSFFEYQVGLKNWMIRLQATMMNLVDGYPPFGTKSSWNPVQLTVPYPESLSRGLVIVRTLFGAFYLFIPHGFCLIFRMMGSQILSFLAWWVVLFTGSYPLSWHEFNVGTLRWMTRVGLYADLLTDEYPPFSGLDTSAAAPPSSGSFSERKEPAATPA